jgi:hypothetical protein
MFGTAAARATADGKGRQTMVKVSDAFATIIDNCCRR